ncbi:MAG: hypothetical protein COV76_01440 [Candidatus Omnitrophica bacterium CG11_big_fil_rev_8_21_14_0_20_64_10]|nr:MAG: hypothetical protein COV76_01440 [Candidatus Omnitrophica bacterium CG11_big_fil_rev_8_21_14_0_20_64_10]
MRRKEVKTDQVSRRTAVFLDRDGVINASPGEGYVTDWRGFRFLPGALPALKRLKEMRLPVILLSNQSGVGRGRMSRIALAEIDRRMRRTVRNKGGRITASHYCVHAPGRQCGCRKPKLGLLRRAVRGRKIEIQRSYWIGDTAVDVRMGRRAGLKTILVLSGKTRAKDLRRFSAAPDHIAKNLLDAVQWIRKERT